MSESAESTRSISRLRHELDDLERELDAIRLRNTRDRCEPQKRESRRWQESCHETPWRASLLAELRTLRHLIEHHRGRRGCCSPQRAGQYPPYPPFPPYPPYPPFPPFPPYPPPCAPSCNCGTVPCSCRKCQPSAPSSSPICSSSSSSSSSSPHLRPVPPVSSSSSSSSPQGTPLHNVH